MQLYNMWRSEETPWLIGVVGLVGGSVLYLLWPYGDGTLCLLRVVGTVFADKILRLD